MANTPGFFIASSQKLSGAWNSYSTTLLPGTGLAMLTRNKARRIPANITNELRQRKKYAREQVRFGGAVTCIEIRERDRTEVIWPP
jgi:hypothetical protein